MISIRYDTDMRKKFSHRPVVTYEDEIHGTLEFVCDSWLPDQVAYQVAKILVADSHGLKEVWSCKQKANLQDLPPRVEDYDE